MSENEILCKVCDEGFSEYPNEIVICDNCELGYHQFCHQPSIPECVIKYPDIPWVCKKCFYQMSRKERVELCKKSQLNEDDLEFFDDKKKKKKKSICNSNLSNNQKNDSNNHAIENSLKNAIKNQNSSSYDQIEDQNNLNKNIDLKNELKIIENNDLNNDVNAINKIKMCNKLPYDLDSLVWDEDHLANLNNIYCYCGKGVEHCRSMLQCFECRQWFHTICITSLSYELLIGDQYFKFVCSVCNQSEESCKRIIMKWSVAVGLALSNLTYGSDRRFFNIEQDIIPFLIENESLFNLSTSLDKLSTNELKDKIEVNLKSNKDKFICNDKKDWSLNVSFPYEDPLTFTPFATSCQSSLAKQNISFQNSSLNTDTNKNLTQNEENYQKTVPIGACRKGPSVIPMKPNKKLFQEFKQLNNLNNKNKKKTEISKRIKRGSVGGSSNNSSSTEDSFYLNNTMNKKILGKNQGLKNNLSRKTNTQSRLKSNRKNNLLEEQNLLDLDSIIPYPENFEGPNNPFYCFNLTKNNSFQEDREIDQNNYENDFNVEKKSKDHLSSNFTNIEYRIVSKDPKFPKLVFSRVATSNENSFKNFNSNAKNFNNHTDCKNDPKLDDFKVLAQRITIKGNIEYMVECDEKL